MLSNLNSNNDFTNSVQLLVSSSLHNSLHNVVSFVEKFRLRGASRSMRCIQKLTSNI